MEEIKKKIRKKLKEIEILSKIKGLTLLSGNYKSVFRGSGYNFEELREYVPGDPIKYLDWKKYSVYDKPFTKVYEDERERRIYFLVDMRSSMAQGFSETKREMASEFVAYLAHTSLFYKDKVSLILFDDRIRTVLPPSNYRNETMVFVERILTGELKNTKTNWNNILSQMYGLMKSNFILFIVSDFMDFPGDLHILNTLQKKGDITGIFLSHLKDVPSELREMVPVTHGENILSYKKTLKQENYFIEKLKKQFNKQRFSFINCQTDEDALWHIKNFFMKRRLK